MALSKLNTDLNIVQGLDDQPNAVTGLTAAQVKAKFDEAGNAIKTYVNDTLTTEIEIQFASKQDVNNVILGQIPDGSLTDDKLSDAEGQVKSQLTQLTTKQGDLTTLSTTEKSNLVGAINELFTNANNGKTLISNVVGSPLLATDTFQQQSDKIQALKNTMATNLTNKGQNSIGTEGLTNLIDKIANIPVGKKSASGTGVVGELLFFQYSGTTSTTNVSHISVSGLDFKPSTIVAFSTSGAYRMTVVSSQGHPYYNPSAICSPTASVSSTASTLNFKANVSPAYLNNGSFLIPITANSGDTCFWMAYE